MFVDSLPPRAGGVRRDGTAAASMHQPAPPHGEAAHYPVRPRPTCIRSGSWSIPTGEAAVAPTAGGRWSVDMGTHKALRAGTRRPGQALAPAIEQPEVRESPS